MVFGCAKKQENEKIKRHTKTPFFYNEVKGYENYSPFEIWGMRYGVPNTTPTKEKDFVTKEPKRLFPKGYGKR